MQGWTRAATVPCSPSSRLRSRQCPAVDLVTAQGSASAFLDIISEPGHQEPISRLPVELSWAG